MTRVKNLLQSGYFYTFLTTGIVYGSKYLLDQYIGINQSQENYFIWNKIQSLALIICQVPFFAIYLAGLPKVNSFKDIKNNNSLNVICNSLFILLITISFLISSISILIF